MSTRRMSARFKQDIVLQVSQVISPKKKEDTATDDDDGGTIPSIEEKREQNIRDNAEFLATLGISKARDNLKQAIDNKPKPSYRGLKRKLQKSEPVPRRAPSLRLQNKDPTGEATGVAGPSYVPYVSEEKERPSGTLEFNDVLTNHVEDKTQATSFVKLLKSLGKVKAESHAQSNSADKFIKSIKKISLTQERVAKVVGSRIFSVAIHPTEDKVLVLAGGKWGGIGVWDVEATSSKEHGVYLYEPHSRPVNCIKVSPFSATHLYSASYDGSVRCGDIITGLFTEVYLTPHEDRCTFFDFLSSNELVVAQSDGCMALIDQRTAGTQAVAEYPVHNRLVKSVSVHPVNKQYVLSSSNDSTVHLWDIRNMRKKSESVDVLHHSKSVDSAYFSPVTGKYIVTTCIDDKIRIYDSRDISNINQVHNIRHNNHTGRWLTNFRATWHVTREDIFVVGSMAHPRQIELFSPDSGHMVETFTGDNLKSVCSCNAFHPTRNILVGGNSSGRVHVFM